MSPDDIDEPNRRSFDGAMFFSILFALVCAFEVGEDYGSRRDLARVIAYALN